MALSTLTDCRISFILLLISLPIQEGGDKIRSDQMARSKNQRFPLDISTRRRQGQIKEKEESECFPKLDEAD
jgi:hypothetical protein